MGRKPSPPDKNPTPHWSISGLILGGLCVCASEWVIAYSVTGGHPAKLIPTFFIVMFLLLVIVRFTNVTDKHFPEAPPSDSQPGMEASFSGQPPPTTRLLFTSSPFWDRVLLTVLGIVSFFLWSHSKGDVPRDIFGTLFLFFQMPPAFFFSLDQSAQSGNVPETLYERAPCGYNRLSFLYSIKESSCVHHPYPRMIFRTGPSAQVSSLPKKPCPRSPDISDCSYSGTGS